MQQDNRAAGPHEAVSALLAAAVAEQIDLHSILVMQRGAVLAEAYNAPFDAETPHRMYSVTKSFTATAIGLAISEGRLRVEDRIVDLFPEFVPAAADAHRDALRVKHLLTMSSGHRQAPFSPLARPIPSLAAFVGQAPEVAPGSRFDYSNHCSYALAAIVERLTGETLPAYLAPRLFEPLDIAVRPWLRSEEGVSNGGWGLHLTTREVSRFGQMLLQHGVWRGRELVPAAWIEEMTGRRAASWGNSGLRAWREGYGYQFWRGRHGSYRADGLLGQFCIAFPELEAVVVTTGGTMRTQRLLEFVWELVLPTLRGGGASPAVTSPVFPDARAGAPDSLRRGELAGIDFAIGEPFLLPTRLYSGQVACRGARVETEGDAMALVLTDERGAWRLVVGTSDWAAGTTPLSTGYPEPYRARATWTSPATLLVELVFTEAGFRLGLEFGLEPAPQLKVTLPANPGFDNRVLVGRPFP